MTPLNRVRVRLLNIRLCWRNSIPIRYRFRFQVWHGGNSLLGRPYKDSMAVRILLGIVGFYFSYRAVRYDSVQLETAIYFLWIPWDIQPGGCMRCLRIGKTYDWEQVVVGAETKSDRE